MNTLPLLICKYMLSIISFQGVDHDQRYKNCNSNWILNICIEFLPNPLSDFLCNIKIALYFYIVMVLFTFYP